ncbi:hypothetical protein [Mycoplasmopsis agassizii]|uniref:Uncharacterized protein n=1 Tax=Mycoplasmopsis agassizii TaxID=33922 RepID=A0ABX4H697_9BACT|nr:hypothetical protein [Mycoplasmopsis agassizii]PAF55373.1 hypothetical protein CJF60_01635 [Mycoplasmopsis agassizii]SMC20563.1 hypothetical protein SAMN02745179_01029 [Mycoplasmopsis agassizii]
MLPLLTPLKIKDHFKYKEYQQTDEIIIISEDKDSYFFNELFKYESHGNYSIKTQKQNYSIDRYVSYEIKKDHLDNLVYDQNDETNVLLEKDKIKLLYDIHKSLEKNIDDHTIVFLKPYHDKKPELLDQLAAAKNRHQKIANAQSSALTNDDELANTK